MNEKITAVSIAILMIAVSLTVGFSKSGNGDLSSVTYVKMDTYAAKATTSTTSATTTTQGLGGFVSDKLDGVTILGDIAGDASDVIGGVGELGGIGDSIGGIGDALSGILGGLGGVGSGDSDDSGDSNGSDSGNNTYAIDTEPIPTISYVPAVSSFDTELPGVSEAATERNDTANETVDFSATQNPYQRPTGELKGGDRGEGVKWMQWIFIYTRYGLKDDGITGVFDEDTMAVVKKLQKENGMTTDGIVNDDVIDKIERLYYEATYSNPSSAIATTVSDTNTVADTAQEKNSNTSLVALVIIVAVVWVIAIGFIVAFAVIKKKKKAQNDKNTDTVSLSDAKTEESKESESANTDDNDKKSSETSIKDLFDEVDK